MECANHLGVAASAACARCDRPLCGKCAEEHKGNTLCATCAEYVRAREAQRAGASGGSRAATGPPAAEPGATPAGTPAAAAAAAAPDDGLYSGGHDRGELYDPAAAAAPAPGRPVRPVEPSGGSLGRVVAVAAVVGLVCTGIWYGVAVLTEKEFALVALLIGLAIGVASAAAAGRRGGDVAGVSVVVFLISIVAGEYLIQNHFYRQILALGSAASEVVMDGDYTDGEAAALAGVPEEEWEELSAQERQEIHELLAAEHAEESEDAWEEEDGWEDEESADEEWEGETEVAALPELPALPPSLPIGEFLGNLHAYLGLFGFLFLGIGGWQAWKIPYGGEE